MCRNEYGEAAAPLFLLHAVVGDNPSAALEAEGQRVHAGDTEGEAGLLAALGEAADDVLLRVRHAVAEVVGGLLRSAFHEQAVAVHVPRAGVLDGAVGVAGLHGLHVAVSGGELEGLSRQVGMLVFSCDLGFHVVAASGVQEGGGRQDGGDEEVSFHSFFVG